MADVFTKSKRSEVMSRIRSRGNRDTELALARLLRANGISGWRRQVEIRGRDAALRRPRPVQGRNTSGTVATLHASRTSQRDVPTFRVRPDFVFLKSRTAIFVDGCFWHGCPKHATRPVNNRAFWRRKLAGNKVRDRLVTRTLRALGWRVVRIWEHELAKRNKAQLLRRILARTSDTNVSSI
ncbi:MAG: very short patch repair endonuclease [Limisphaerales bacterium]